MGVPGLAVWLMTMPLRVSAVCWINVPVNVTGAMNPDNGIAINSTGIKYPAQSSRFCEVTPLHFKGEVGQHEKMVRGFSFRAVAAHRTAAGKSFITSKDSIVKAPVTTGLLPYSRLRYRR